MRPLLDSEDWQAFIAAVQRLYEEMRRWGDTFALVGGAELRARRAEERARWKANRALLAGKKLTAPPTPPAPVVRTHRARNEWRGKRR